MASAKHIIIPPDAPATDEDGVVVLDDKGCPVMMRFLDFIRGRTKDRQFAASPGEGCTFDDLEEGAAVRKACAEAILSVGVGGKWLVDSTHYERLCRAVRKPQGGWDPRLPPQMLTFMRAVLDAKDAPASVKDGDG